VCTAALHVCDLTIFCCLFTSFTAAILMPTSTRSIASTTSQQSPIATESDMDNLSASAKKIVLLIREDLRIMKEEILGLLELKSKEINDMKDEIAHLKSTVSRLEEKIDDSDSYERRDTVVFSGCAIPPATPDEICRDMVVDIVKNKLRLNIAPSDISTAHRLGKRPVSQLPDNRKIAVKLCRRDLKRDLLFSRRNLKPEGLYISESLTPVRNTILFVLRKMKRAHPNIVKGCTSIDGRVFGFVASDGDRPKRLLVNCHQQLLDFCDNVVGKPLTDFLDSWPH